MPNGLKPMVFVGSSLGALDVAQAVQSVLKDHADVRLWRYAFDLSTATLDNLFKVVERADFAVLVLGADDLTESFGVTQTSPRDNVIFELGLFMGKLGKDRVFGLRSAGQPLKIPSDLAGITLGSYEKNPGGDLRDAVATALYDALDRIRRLGPRPKMAMIRQHELADTMLGICKQCRISLANRSRRVQKRNRFPLSRMGCSQRKLVTWQDYSSPEL
jgi:predicted nucleotide-binding protein